MLIILGQIRSPLKACVIFHMCKCQLRYSTVQYSTVQYRTV